MSELKPCPECGGPAEVCGTSYADRHYEHRRAPSPAVDRLVEASKSVLGFIPEGWEMPLGFGQFAGRLRVALAAVEAEKDTHLPTLDDMDDLDDIERRKP